MNRPLLVLFSAVLVTFDAVPRAQGTSPDLFAASRSARDGGRFGMLLRQFRADEPALPEHHEAGRRDAMAVYQGTRDIPAGNWVWSRPYWFVFRDAGAAPQPRSWGPEAACGAPDVPQPGDHVSAWATDAEDKKDEWLLLEYAAPVRVTSVEVHETFNPGAVAAIAILTPQGDEIELWRNREVKPADEKGRIMQIDLPVGFEVERIKLHLASDTVPGWNEIDAVGLRDDKGKTHWASRAGASSTYADTAQQQARPAPVNLQLAIQRGQVQFQVQPRVVFQAPQPVIQLGQPQAFRVHFVEDGDAEKLRARIAELEAKVKQLEADLARARK
jgi:hypothetical protein